MVSGSHLVLKCTPLPHKGDDCSIAYWGRGIEHSVLQFILLSSSRPSLHSPLEQKSSFALIYQFNIGHLLSHMWWALWHNKQLKPFNIYVKT